MKIVIDGNIGCGKSTIIKMLQDNLDNKTYGFVQEDVNDWDEYITEYYKDIQKNSLLFQMKVLFHHLTNKKQLKKIDIHERSPLSCIDIFGENLKNQNYLGSLDLKLMNSYNQEYGWTPDVIIYIKTTPEIVKKRVDLRSRSGEKIPLEYLSKINELYNRMYMSGESTVEPIHILCVDGDDLLENIFTKILLIVKNL